MPARVLSHAAGKLRSATAVVAATVAAAPPARRPLDALRRADVINTVVPQGPRRADLGRGGAGVGTTPAWRGSILDGKAAAAFRSTEMRRGDQLVLIVDAKVSAPFPSMETVAAARREAAEGRVVGIYFVKPSPASTSGGGGADVFLLGADKQWILLAHADENRAAAMRLLARAEAPFPTGAGRTILDDIFPCSGRITRASGLTNGAVPCSGLTKGADGIASGLTNGVVPCSGRITRSSGLTNIGVPCWARDGLHHLTIPLARGFSTSSGGVESGRKEQRIQISCCDADQHFRHAENEAERRLAVIERLFDTQRFAAFSLFWCWTIDRWNKMLILAYLFYGLQG